MNVNYVVVFVCLELRSMHTTLSALSPNWLHKPSKYRRYRELYCHSIPIRCCLSHKVYRNVCTGFYKVKLVFSTNLFLPPLFPLFILASSGCNWWSESGQIFRVYCTLVWCLELSRYNFHEREVQFRKLSSAKKPSWLYSQVLDGDHTSGKKDRQCER